MKLCVWQRARYINNVYKAFVALYHYSMSTNANRPEKKDRVLKTYVYCMTKLFIKHLFISSTSMAYSYVLVN